MLRKLRRRRCRHCRCIHRGHNPHRLCQTCLDKARCKLCRLVIAGRRSVAWCDECKAEHRRGRGALLALNHCRADAATAAVRLAAYGRRNALHEPLWEPIPYVSELPLAGPWKCDRGAPGEASERSRPPLSILLGGQVYVTTYPQIKARRLDSFAEFVQANDTDADAAT